MHVLKSSTQTPGKGALAIEAASRAGGTAEPSSLLGIQRLEKGTHFPFPAGRPVKS